MANELTPTEPADVETEDAYSLLSKPTLELTDAQVAVVVSDLRARRARHVATGKADAPRKALAKPKAEKPTEAMRKEASRNLLADLGLDLGDLKL